MELQAGEMNWDTFVKKYKPIKNNIVDNASFDGLMFETFGEEIDHVKKVASRRPNCVWTVVDDGATDVWAGFHLVNRLGYIITKNPAESEFLYVINEDYEEEEFDE